MAKKSSSIENRVYLFDTLAGALLSGQAGELLVSSRPGDRARAMKALAEAAYVSCVVADTGNLDARGVREALLGPEAQAESTPAAKRPAAKRTRKPSKAQKAKAEKPEAEKAKAEKPKAEKPEPEKAKGGKPKKRKSKKSE